MKKITTLLILLLAVGTYTYSQNITLKVTGVPDTTVHLVKYFGSKLYYADTSEMKGGKVTFNGSKQEPGVLALLLPGQRYFEFIYNNEEIFIETKSPNYVEDMVVKKSKENQIFLDYLRYMKDNRSEADVLREQFSETEDEAKKEELKQKINAISDKVHAHQDKLAVDYKDLLVGKIIKMSTEVPIPEELKNSDNSPENNLRYYNYTRDHYFDNIDLKDDRLVNTPVFQNKIEYFYSPNMLLSHPDTIIKYITPVVNQLEEGSVMYRFVVQNITSHFEKSKIMGMDKVMNYMIHNYYCAKDKDGNYKGYWMDKDKLDDLCKDTEFRIRLMIGEVPPNLILPDTTNQKWYNMYEVKADYTILYFWDPNCGHCKKVTPQLEELYAKKFKARNVEIFAIGKATGDDFEAWKKFIKTKKLNFINVGVTKDLYEKAKENPYSVIPSKTTLESINYQETYDIYSTPRMWVLDKNKKIIAKSLSIAQLERFLDDLQGHSEDEKIFELEETEEMH